MLTKVAMPRRSVRPFLEGPLRVSVTQEYAGKPQLSLSHRERPPFLELGDAELVGFKGWHPEAVKSFLAAHASAPGGNRGAAALADLSDPVTVTAYLVFWVE